MFYVYEHWRPDRDEPFYVGKGKGGRANLMARRNGHHTAIQKKLHAKGMSVEVRIVASSLSEEDAFRIEVERIAMWSSLGMDLANKTLGGEGVAGLVFSEEHRRKLGDATRGKKRPPKSEQQRRKHSEFMKGNKFGLGKKHSPETKKKIADSRIGIPSPAKGIPKSEEQKRKISESLSRSIKGKKNPFWGKRHTEETKKKISETKRLRAKS
jgi:hypothetical protein